MDKKYREKLPGMIKDLSLESLSDLEPEGPVVNKKRKSKKIPKLSREGVYPKEEEHVKRWWLSDNSRRQHESNDEYMSRRIRELQVRETLVQVMLVLEILALEATPEFKAAQAAGQSVPQETQNDAEPQTKKRRFKKPEDLQVLLDLFLDKLSIWQSVEDDFGAGTTDNDGKLRDRDLLASFCGEVVIPFYKSRVPEKAALVNKTFNGPGAVSPDKFRKPNAREPVQKNAEKRSRQPLQKTPSESFSQTKIHRPSLARSATDSAMPRMKREASEISLRDISPVRPATRGTSVQLKHLQQRQIDMTALAAATKAKLNRKANIEEQLKGAIHTLKKPNRGLAVKEYVESNEQRSLGSASMRKKTARKVLQNSPNVQVSATPRVIRKTDHFVPMTAQKSRLQQEYSEQEPPSSISCIPSSAIRPPTSGRTTNNQPLFRRAQFDTSISVSETPSRGRSKITSFSDLNNPSLPPEYSSSTHLKAHGMTTIESTPSRRSSKHSFFPPKISHTDDTVPQTPSKPHRGFENKRPPLFATPQKPTSWPSAPNVQQTPEPLPKLTTTPKQPTSVDDGRDLYDALGWNDDFDDI